MFPYVILWPFWIAASLVWPVLQSLHVLHTKDVNGMKVWLFYWLGYAVLSFLFSFTLVDTLAQLPFTIISVILFDLYYEAQLFLVIALVTPKLKLLEKLVSIGDQHVSTVSTQIEEKLELARVAITKQVNDMGLLQSMMAGASGKSEAKQE